MSSARPTRTIRPVKKYGFDASSDESEDENEHTREVDLDISDDSDEESSDEDDDRMRPSSNREDHWTFVNSSDRGAQMLEFSGNAGWQIEQPQILSE